MKIVPLETFKNDVKTLQKKYKNIFRDLIELNRTLQNSPKARIPLGNNCFKIRLGKSSVPTGKRGGFRIIHYFLSNDRIIFLMTIFSKSDQNNISNQKIIQILKNNDLY